MIVTKNWLNDFLDLSDVSTDKICETLNSIGLEVDSLNSIKIPAKVVVGEVETCEKHPDADKLSICSVNIGNQTVQIVCGAKNVAAGQIVPVATIGADLGNGFVIKDAKLRGVASSGMICSSNEIGLPKLNDGILVLDQSIGELSLGKELCTFENLNDDIIDIELTANRGDCLSIYGVARDLSSALDIKLKNFTPKFEEIEQSVSTKIKVTYNDFNANTKLALGKNENIKISLLNELRLAFCEINDNTDELQKLITYTSHSTGVLVRAHKFVETLSLISDPNGLDTIYTNNEKLSTIGVMQCPKMKASKDDEEFILEASYVHPDVISQKTYKIKDLHSDRHFYNSTRGSEVDLEFGLDFCKTLLNTSFYKTDIKVGEELKQTVININIDELSNFIGQEITKDEFNSILRHLGFNVDFINNISKVEVPLFRADIKNMQDIAEEIVRIKGIDNIASTPLNFNESNHHNETLDTYHKKLYYKNKASAEFYETTNYFFTHKQTLKEYGFDTLKKDLDLSNPISSELDTLRSTLITNMILNASNNIRNGIKSVRLFELGTVVDKNRNESTKFTFLFSGNVEDNALINNDKPKQIDFLSFANAISKVIGNFEVKSDTTTSKLFNPYEFGKVIIDNKEVGLISSLHINETNKLDLPATYICELNFDALNFQRKLYTQASKYQAVDRNLSLLVPKNLPFKKIKTFISSFTPSELINFYPVDIFESEELKENLSLTVKFIYQSNEKTLTDEDVNGIEKEILEKLDSEMGVGIR